jgi:hypothetical protein
VRLIWEVQSGNLVLDGSEIGGPPVESPLTKGYGTKFINATIERQLDGAATFE